MVKNTAKLFTQKVLGSTVSLKPWTNMPVRRKLWKFSFDRCTRKIILKQGPCADMTRFSNTVQIDNFSEFTLNLTNVIKLIVTFIP